VYVCTKKGKRKRENRREKCKKMSRTRPLNWCTEQYKKGLEETKKSLGEAKKGLEGIVTTINTDIRKKADKIFPSESAIKAPIIYDEVKGPEHHHCAVSINPVVTTITTTTISSSISPSIQPVIKEQNKPQNVSNDTELIAPKEITPPEKITLTTDIPKPRVSNTSIYIIDGTDTADAGKQVAIVESKSAVIPVATDLTIQKEKVDEEKPESIQTKSEIKNISQDLITPTLTNPVDLVVKTVQIEIPKLVEITSETQPTFIKTEIPIIVEPKEKQQQPVPTTEHENVCVTNHDEEDVEVLKKNTKEKLQSVLKMERTMTLSLNRKKQPKGPFTVILFGDVNVGKTSMIKRLVLGPGYMATEATIGVDFVQRTIVLPQLEISVTLVLWDTAGAEEHKTFLPSYMRRVDAAVVVYACNDKKSLPSLSGWWWYLKDKVPDGAIWYAVGNKLDSVPEAERTEAYTRGKQMATSTTIPNFYVTSAKTGDGIEDLFVNIANDLMFRNARREDNNFSFELLPPPPLLTRATNNGIKKEGRNVESNMNTDVSLPTTMTTTTTTTTTVIVQNTVDELSSNTPMKTTYKRNETNNPCGDFNKIDRNWYYQQQQQEIILLNNDSHSPNTSNERKNGYRINYYTHEPYESSSSMINTEMETVYYRYDNNINDYTRKRTMYSWC
jgi:small GTP-binding protein